MFPSRTRFFLTLAVFTYATSAISANPSNTWVTKQSSQDGAVYESKVKGLSGQSNFPTKIMVRIGKSETYLGFIIPKVEKFKHLDLHALADDNNEGPNPTMMVVKCDSNSQSYSFVAHGEFFEDETNGNIFSFQFHIGNNQNETNQLRNLLNAVSTQPGQWSFSITHKGKAIAVQASFTGIQRQLQKWLKQP